MSSLVDMTGKRYWRFTVISRAGSNKYKRAMWNCRCDCGTRMVVEGVRLTTGNTRSCGCLDRETKLKRTATKKTHGMTRTPEYVTWQAMRSRCENPSHKDYAGYGGRGIKVCDRWQKFENFFADMGKRPGTNHSIDRVDNEKDYQPGNCQWATIHTQTRNRRSTKLFEIDGETLCASDWAERFGIQRTTLLKRLRRGVPFEVAIQKGGHDSRPE